MTKTEDKTASGSVKEILLSSPDGLREVIRAVMQEVLGPRWRRRRAQKDVVLAPAGSSKSVARFATALRKLSADQCHPGFGYKPDISVLGPVL